MKPKTFAEMKKAFDDYVMGLLTFAEVIQQVQCTDAQLKLLTEYNKLPNWAQQRIELVELDSDANLTKGGLKKEKCEEDDDPFEPNPLRQISLPRKF